MPFTRIFFRQSSSHSEPPPTRISRSLLVSGCGRCGCVFYQIRNLPVTAVVPLHDLAVGTNHGCAEVVRNQSAFGLDSQREEVGNLRQVRGAGSSEFPSFEE